MNNINSDDLRLAVKSGPKWPEKTYVLQYRIRSSVWSDREDEWVDLPTVDLREMELA